MKYFINDLLLRICNKLQLSQTLYNTAEKRYHHISEFLQGQAVFSNVELNMYPHGSFRLKTTVQPISSQEYDLDFVVEISKNTSMNPNELYRNIFDSLKNSDRYTDKVEKKSRCIRINYANEFHLDIMPGKLIEDSMIIQIPDKKTYGVYHKSNPKGFSEWFENSARMVIEKHYRNTTTINCSTEPVPDQVITAQLEPMRRAVQLIKRYRDIYCDRTKKEPVRSIVICTLLGQMARYANDELDYMDAFCKYVLSLAESDTKPFHVFNPTLKEEKLTEKWDENINYYYDFLSMIETLQHDLIALRSLSENNKVEILLKAMFGESITAEVIREREIEEINSARNANILTVNKDGMLNQQDGNIKVPKNTFYGA